MSLFWLGIIIFAVGVVIRVLIRFKYYNDYKANAHTDAQKEEMRSKYRPLIFIGLGIEVIGCIISVISIFIIEK